MQYPKEILPLLSYKYIDADLNDYFICRIARIETFINRKTGALIDSAWYEKESELLDFSTNLIGNFKLEHNYLTLCGDEKKYFYTYWDFVELVRTPEFEQDFISDSNKLFFFFRIGDLLNSAQIPYLKPKNISGKATLHIEHTPTRSNFWHFSIRCSDDEGKIINSNDANWKYIIINSLKALLSANFYESISEAPLIPETFYLK